MIVPIFAVSFAVIAIFVSSMFLVAVYNRFVKLDQLCENGFGQITIQLQRRYDLIPNLVESARSFMVHERDTLERVIAARNQASNCLQSAKQPGANAELVQQWMGAEGALGSALGRMSFVMEDYPELRSDQNIASLMEELTSTENRISFARQAYNDWCTGFNVYRQSFPNVLFASLFGYAENRMLLEFQDEAAIQQAPKVDLAVSNSK